MVESLARRIQCISSGFSILPFTLSESIKLVVIEHSGRYNRFACPQKPLALCKKAYTRDKSRDNAGKGTFGGFRGSPTDTNI